MLVVENLSVSYGAIRALRGVSFHVGGGEIVALIGANGAGKSTILNTISGIVRPLGGSIGYEGEEITRQPPHRIVARGVCQVPEGRRVFGRMSVQENLEMGGYTLAGGKELARGIERAFALFPLLAERRRQAARTLSGGEQQMLAIARALMSSPRLLLLDEPSMGLAPLLVERIFEIIAAISRDGTTILLVEQNASMALAVAHRAYVLESGEVVLSGAAGELARNPEVRRAYLGE
ncbi:MAG: ABC transporter ATP-binding protein [Deltaproteobacteria bacterium]|nr:ABC transporter ATP-binding protein [Deltaproteobacteria bacterium]